MPSAFVNRLYNRGPLRAELLCAAWETFSALLFASAVLPAVLRTPLAALVFAATLVASALGLPYFVSRGDAGMSVASWLRVAAWLIALLPVPARTDSRTWIATAAFGVMAAAMRRAIYRRELTSPPQGSDSQAYSAWFRARLGEGATLAGVVGGHFLLLFSVAFLHAESKVVFRGWFVFLPLLAAGATALYSVAMRLMTREVIAVVEVGQSAPRARLLVAARRLYDLPLRLSLTNFALWVACTFLGVFYFRPGPASWQSADALLQLVYAALFAWGVAFYQRGWDRDTIAHVQRLLYRWAGVEQGQDEAAAPPRYARFAIRERMLRDFGWPLVFAAVLMLLSSIGLYRTLGAHAGDAEGQAVLAQVAAFLMLALAVGGVIARVALELTRPIVAVAEAAELVAEGQLENAMPVVPGPFEVAKLATSVERMRGRLARTIGELEAERASLEDKVRARTSELERALDDLREAQAVLLQSERLASIGALVAGVAHEIGNPLNAVSGAVDPLGARVSDVRRVLARYQELEERLAPEARDSIRALREQVDLEATLEDLEGISRVVTRATGRAVKIVQNLKHFTHVSGDSAPTDLQLGIDETLTLLGPRIKVAGVHVTREFGAEDLVVECRAGEINQIFMNLCVNAIMALESCEQGAPRRLHIATRADDDEVTIAFDDSGPGVPKGLQGRIFDPFFTTKPPGQGTGLGLSISGDIAQKHGGSLLLSESTLGGACFVLRLPRRPGQRIRLSEPPSASAPQKDAPAST